MQMVLRLNVSWTQDCIARWSRERHCAICMGNRQAQPSAMCEDITGHEETLQPVHQRHRPALVPSSGRADQLHIRLVLTA